jgi:hypothetical protein
MYKIKYYYETCNSFGRQDDEGYLDLEWRDKSVAQDNLNRIREHYEYYRAIDSKSYFSRPEKEQAAKKAIEKAEGKDWLVPTEKDYDFSHHQIVLYTDDGKPWQFWAPWCGYFESLYSAEIVQEDSRDRIEF